jgi:rod shape determining protein RodA
VFALGKSVYGSQRWYQLGPLQLQPSEFAVLALIVVIATYCGRRTGVLAFRETMALLVLAGIPLVLVYKQPDLGTTIILGITLAAMLLAAGVRMRYLAMLLVCVVGGFYLAIHLHILQKYQLDRLTSFLQQNKGLRTTNYDVNMSKNAISAGGTYGTGIGKGAATNLSFIPNQETDFIFSAVGEQLGFVGSAVVIALFGVISFRMMRAAQMAKDTFGRLLAAGSLAFLSFSVFENVGMATGIMPVTGIPLPFISYGGSASFAFFACIGLVVNVEMRRVARR